MTTITQEYSCDLELPILGTWIYVSV